MYKKSHYFHVVNSSTQNQYFVIFCDDGGSKFNQHIHYSTLAKMRPVSQKGKKRKQICTTFVVLDI